MAMNALDTSQFLLGGYYRPPVSGLGPRHLVVIFHGLSADATGMIALADRWASRLPDAGFIAPNAPFPFDMGPTGFQWFSILNRTCDSDLARLKATANTLDQFLDDALIKLGLEDSKLALVGFSQGGMVALHVGIRRAVTPAAIVCMSGTLVGSGDLPKAIAMRPPILLTHGAADTVVPIGEMFATRAALESAGFAVQCLTRPDEAHTFDDQTIDKIGDFLEGQFYGGPCTQAEL